MDFVYWFDSLNGKWQTMHVCADTHYTYMFTKGSMEKSKGKTKINTIVYFTFVLLSCIVLNEFIESWLRFRVGNLHMVLRPDTKLLSILSIYFSILRTQIYTRKCFCNAINIVQRIESILACSVCFSLFHLFFFCEFCVCRRSSNCWLSNEWVMHWCLFMIHVFLCVRLFVFDGLCYYPLVGCITQFSI